MSELKFIGSGEDVDLRQLSPGPEEDTPYVFEEESVEEE